MRRPNGILIAVTGLALSMISMYHKPIVPSFATRLFVISIVLLVLGAIGISIDFGLWKKEKKQ